MKTNRADPAAPRAAEQCSIVVIYDDHPTRARAMAACDYFVQQFWDSVELNFHWWRTDFLNDPDLARMAAQDATACDFLVLCAGREGELPPAWERWTELWIEQRGAAVGALIDLGGIAGNRSLPASGARVESLRQICRRGNFDYLTVTSGANTPLVHLPNNQSRDSNEPRPPSHSGLNE